MYKDKRERVKEPEDQFKEKLIHINRVAKVVKGGRRFSFSALVAVGDGNGSVGLGYGKANEVAEAIRKGIMDAKNNMFQVAMAGNTIPYMITARVGAASVMMKPARPGTGIIAGGAVRAILETAGVRDIVAKNIGTKNQINSAKAAIHGLKSLRTPEDFADRRKASSTQKKKDPKDRRDRAKEPVGAAADAGDSATEENNE
jgi:small subunit ribosomal protein S5